jgi:hypothetical protein
MNRIFRKLAAGHRSSSAWRVLWLMAALSGAAIGIGAPGEITIP